MTEVDLTRLNELCDGLHEALSAAGKPGDAGDVVRDETRRLTVQTVKFMPPQNNAVGKRAIASDLTSFFSAAEPGLIDTIGSEHGIGNVDAFITAKDGKPLRLRWDRIDPLGNNMRTLHYSAKRRGRVRRGGRADVKGEWRARVVVTKEARDEYVKKIQARVGRLKASIAATAAALGVTTIATWIKRHFPNPKAIVDITGLQQAESPAILFGSRAPGIGSYRSQIVKAAHARSQAIKKRIRLIASNYSKDVAAGIRADAAAKRSRSRGTGGSYAIG